MSSEECAADFHMGAIVTDTEVEDGDPAVVVNCPPIPANEWDVKGRGLLSEDNPDYPATSPTVIVVYLNRLLTQYPHYSGFRPIQLTELLEKQIKFYAFPEGRLQHDGGFLGPHEIPLDKFEPYPAHARNFEYAENEDYINDIKQRGTPSPPPVVRPLDSGRFQIINGHKRIWASHVAGLEQISVCVTYLSDKRARDEWARRHMYKYSPEAEEIANERLSKAAP